MARKYTAGAIVTRAAQRSREELEYVSEHHSSSFILVVIYLVGMIGLVFNIHPSFIFLTPINLLVSLGIVLYHHPTKNKAFYSFLYIAFMFGFLIEIAGVSSGLIFGEYYYGEVLGPKIKGTPLMIGVNWVMLIYCCGAALSRFFPKRNIYFKSFIGALALVSLDILIEPVAMYYEFWYWGDNNIVPLQNYVAWFMISFILLMVFHLLIKDLKNNAAFTLFNLQFIFFLIVGIDW